MGLYSYDMCSLAPTIAQAMGMRTPRSAMAPPIQEAIATLGRVERLAVVVIDAFGASTWGEARDETPFLNRLAEGRLLYIASVMPSITPVNFATMLTGVTPDEHGIRERTQPLNHETLFHILREAGKTSATAARALSSLGILISPHADHPGLAESNTDGEVTELALKAIEAKKDLVWVHLLDVDDAGHAHGPYSPESIKACRGADSHLRAIAEAAHLSGYGLIVLADHGQHAVTKEDGSRGGTHGTEMEEDLRVPLVWASNADLLEALKE